MKKIIKGILEIPNLIYNKMILAYRHVKYGKNLQIRGKIFCVSNSKDGIVIGDDVVINSCRKSNPIGGDTKTQLFARGNGKIQIGNGCGISNATLFAEESIILGDDVIIGGSTKIYDTDFHWLDLGKRIREPGGITKPVEIKTGAFIGSHCIILKGVTIGEESIIGAGSVVTKDVPDREIWAGNPAKFIRKLKEI